MVYYKVLNNNGNVIDLVSGNRLLYVKYQEKHSILLLCDEREAMGIVSDTGKCYHLVTCLPFPNDDYPTASIERITEAEYEQLQRCNFMTADEIRSDLIKELIKRGIL